MVGFDYKKCLANIKNRLKSKFSTKFKSGGLPLKLWDWYGQSGTNIKSMGPTLTMVQPIKTKILIYVNARSMIIRDQQADL